MTASVFLTRPQGKNEALATMLAATDLQVNILPALQVFPMDQGDESVPGPHDCQLLVFVSGLAASFYLDAIGARETPFRWPDHTYAATVGWASARPLYDAGVIPKSLILHPDADALAQDSEALWPLLAPILPSVQQALIIRGPQGREWLGQRLEDHGIDVRRYAMYQRQPATWTATQQDAVRRVLTTEPSPVFLLTSSESVDAVLGNIQMLGLLTRFAYSRFVVVHPRIGDHLRQSLKTAGQVPPSMVKICSPTDIAIFQALQDSAFPDASS